MRQRRFDLVSKGQSSPDFLSDAPIQLFKAFNVRGCSIVDVGCGLGVHAKRISESLPGGFDKIFGVDWSQSTVNFHRTSGIYNSVCHADSAKLPIDDNFCDFSLSMENLEHLYAFQSIDAISELARISKVVVITTPLPQFVVNTSWLNSELIEAIEDNIPLSYDHYLCLESAIHKSSLNPLSMENAGFHRFGAKDHGYYWGKSKNIDVTKIKCYGISPILDCVGCDDFRLQYIKLILKSFKMRDHLIKIWPECFV